MLRGIGGLLLAALAVAPIAAQEADPKTAATAVNALGWDLYHRQPTDRNLFYSPYSVNQALGMLYLGARGETREQMRRVLHIDGPDAGWQAASRALADALVPKATEKGTPFTLTSANAVFSQRGYAFLPDFLAGVSASYTGSGAREVDFAGDAEGARGVINGWVADQTAKAIPDLIPRGVLNALTRMVLANAVYFKAAWAMPFEAAATTDGDFHRLDGSVVKAPMMRQTERLRYVEGEDYQAVALPYAGGQVSALVVLPAAGKMAAIEQGLDQGKLSGLLGDFGARQVRLALPRFTARLNLPLKANLIALGMSDAFDQAKADLSGIDGSRNLYVTDALHQAFVKVDEKGTEAAAATAVVVGLRSMPGAPVTMTVDRPFLFAVRDNVTGAILFMGRIVDPTA